MLSANVNKSPGRKRWPLAAVLLSLSQAVWGVEFQPLPNFEAVRAAHRPSERLILDRHGEAIAALRIDYSERRGEWLPLGAVSPAMQRAVLLSEDQSFYEHGGVDWAAVTAAGWNWAWGGSPRGASTLSMQLAGMLDPTLSRPGGGRSLEQKMRQMRRARGLEAAWSKQQIFEAYLNLAAFRGELRGIDAVSRVMFGKRAHALDKREAAVAAALLRGPNAAVERVAARACALLREMAAPGLCENVSDHAHQWLHATARPAVDTPVLAPHFARLAVSEAGRSAGEPLRTSLDAVLQRKVLASVRRHLAGMGHAQLTDAAVVVLANRSAEILAYVGSSGEASAAAQVDHARARRQAGSTLKPFLYAQALEAGYLTAASLLDDAPLDVATVSGLYIPQNYDGKHAGLVSVRSALASSLNVPAVKVLMLIGPERFAQHLRRLGLPLEHDGEHYGYSLSLGSADVDLLSLSNAYRVLADAGRWHEPMAVVTEHEPDAAPVQLFDSMTSWLVGDMLSDRRARARTFGLENALTTAFWSAVKTGTSKDMRDNWAVGWSSDYTVGVWVGNSQGLSMRDVSGVSGAAPIWHEIMSYLHEHKPSWQAARPPTLEPRAITFSGELEAPRVEYFLPGTALGQVETAGAQAAVQSRILSPAPGTVIAFDPDMPAANQRLLLRAAPGGAAGGTLHWQVDTERMQGAQAWWPLRPGRFRIVLRDAEGRALDEVSIQVRGLPGMRVAP